MNDRKIIRFSFYIIFNQRSIYIIIKEQWVILHKEKNFSFYCLQIFTLFSHKI